MSCNKCYQKSILTTYTNSSTMVAAGAPVPFTTNLHLTGTSIVHTAGSTTINLVKSGMYLVAFNGEPTVNTDTFQLYRNGVAVSGTAVSGDNPAFVTTIAVNNTCCGSGQDSIPLTIINTGSDTATLANANITVIKLA